MKLVVSIVLVACVGCSGSASTLGTDASADSSASADGSSPGQDASVDGGVDVAPSDSGSVQDEGAPSDAGPDGDGYTNPFLYPGDCGCPGADAGPDYGADYCQRESPFPDASGYNVGVCQHCGSCTIQTQVCPTTDQQNACMCGAWGVPDPACSKSAWPTSGNPPYYCCPTPPVCPPTCTFTTPDISCAQWSGTVATACCPSAPQLPSCFGGGQLDAGDMTGILHVDAGEQWYCCPTDGGP